MYNLDIWLPLYISSHYNKDSTCSETPNERLEAALIGILSVL